MQLPLDVRVTKAKAKKILDTLESQGVKVDYARKDLNTKSRLYNIFYTYGMTEPDVTYASE